MKRAIGIYLCAHLIAMALSGAASVLFYTLAGERWVTGGGGSALWLLPLPLLAAMAYLVGRFLRRAQETPLAAKDVWNAAMGFYVVSLIALGLLWKLDGYELLNIWNLPLLLPMTGLDRFAGQFSADGAEYGKFWTTGAYQNVVYPLLGLLTAAIEPMCVALGLLGREKQSAPALQNENQAASPAGAGAAILNEEKKTNE